MALDVFRGPRHQYGYGLGSIFRNLFRSFRPVLKDTGRYLLRKGLKGAYHTAHDILEGADPKLSMKRRFSELRQDVGQDVKNKVRKLLSGRGKKRRSVKGKQKKNKTRVKKSLPCKKRKKVKKIKKTKKKKQKKSTLKRTTTKKKKKKRQIRSVSHVHGDLF